MGDRLFLSQKPKSPNPQATRTQDVAVAEPVSEICKNNKMPAKGMTLAMIFFIVNSCFS